MDNPWLLTCGLLCVWPFAVFMVGLWIGRNAIRLRSPLYRAGEMAGYSNKQAQRERIQEMVKSPGK